jgi:hypothetical protein
MVPVGWTGEGQGEYEVVGHLTGYPTAYFQVVRRNSREYQSI